jgi:MYXO-CTERM domain-containing protein
MLARPPSRLVPPALLSLLASAAGCTSGELRATLPGAADLEHSFPGRSAAVLRVGTGFVRTAAGFIPRARGRLAVELPLDAAGPVVLRARGVPLSVREIGASGEVHPLEQAVGYRRAGGASFWTALPDGVEEWVRLEPGSAPDGLPAAAWEIEGATLVQHGGAVEVKGPGTAHLWVTAPAAFAEGRVSAPVAARLVARGSTIELYVEAGGRGVLVDPKWVTVAPLPGPLELQAAVALADGRVMVVGGDDGMAFALPVADLYDPTADRWTPAQSMRTARSGHTATRLGSGEVFVAGGESNSTVFVTDAEIYDPATDAWTVTEMPNPHSGHTATLLASGGVLLAGGLFGGSGTSVASNNADLYDPALGVGGSFAPTTHMTTQRTGHAACLLDDGTVLVTGGTDPNGQNLASCEIYDPVAKTWTRTPTSMATARENHRCVTLPDGKVLVAGGDQGSGLAFSVLASAEIYDPAGQSWSPAGAMASPRYLAEMALVNGAEVLIAGGDDGNGALSSTEIFDPAARTWSTGPALVSPHETYSLTTIGTSLVAAGGWDGNEVTTVTERIVLGLPLGSPCTVAGACASGFCTEGVCCDQDCKGICSSCTALLKGTGADGTCGPVPAGTNPGDACAYQGPSTCGTTGTCDGRGACGTYPDGTVCLEPTPCIVAVCSHGVCGGAHQLDDTPCPGGVCVAGTCVPDPTRASGSSGGDGGGGNPGGDGSSGESTGSAGATSGAGGQGGVAANQGVRLSGSGCQATPADAGAPGGAGLGAAMVALVATLRRRRT